jgi:hypothetical protein
MPVQVQVLLELLGGGQWQQHRGMVRLLPGVVGVGASGWAAAEGMAVPLAVKALRPLHGGRWAIIRQHSRMAARSA